jgi:hypothetical protein
MFAKNKISQSMIDAVNKIMSEKEVESKKELLNEAEKVPTATGMKVYGSRYGDSQKARKDQLKTSLDDVKGPSEKDGKLSGGGLYLSKNVKEELKGNQHKIDKNKNNKIDAEDFKMLRKEELKGNQHKIDANKNNKIDAHDFQLLRGKKKVKEDTFASKLLNSLSEKKGTGSSDPLANRQDYAKRHGTGQVYKKTHAGDKTGMTQAFAYDIKRSGPKGKLPEEVEQVDEASTYKLGRADAETKEFPIKQNGEHVGRLEFHVSAGKLHHRAGNAKDVSYDKWHGNPNTESLVNAHVAKHEAEARKHFAKKLKEEVVGEGMLNQLRDRGNVATGQKQQDRKNFDTNTGAALKPNSTISGIRAKMQNKVQEESELNEVSKSEVDHHYDKWTTSEYAPDHHDAGDDNKIHKSALKYLRSTNEPKENHEKIAMHIANKFHGSGIDESAPKKMDDVAKQNLTPAKKGVVGTVKSDFKNFKSFLAGKKETNEEVESLDEDMALFEAEQLFLESSPQEVVSTIQKIRKDVPKDAKEVHQHLDKAEEHFKSGNKMRGLFHATKFFLAARKYNMKEEVESLDEDRYLMKYLLSRGINPKYVDRNTRVGHAKSNEFKKWKADHLNSLIITRESNEMPFDAPYTKNKKDVKDKSGAVHTPMSRAKDLARSALKSVQDKTKIK